MPSEWKFEINKSLEINSIILLNGGKFVSRDEITDHYFTTRPRSTRKLRVFADGKVRLIEFDREEDGKILNLFRKDFSNFDQGLSHIGINCSPQVTLTKIVETYLLDNTTISIHSFDVGKLFLCLEGEESEVLVLLNLLSIDPLQTIVRSFDEIFQ